MRIFRQRARTSGPEKNRFGIELQDARGKAAPGIRLRLKKNPIITGFWGGNPVREPASRLTPAPLQQHSARL
jgi:hypothetical protein